MWEGMRLRASHAPLGDRSDRREHDSWRNGPTVQQSDRSRERASQKPRSSGRTFWPDLAILRILTLQPALAAFDPHGERVWEEASDADENKILISRSYKPGSVRDLSLRTPLAVSRRG